LQIERDLLLIIISTADELSGGTNIDDDFERFQAATHILRVNCAGITGDRPRQPAYEIKLMLSRVS